MNKTAKCYKCGSGKKTRKSRKIKCRIGFPKTENLKVFNQICQNNTTKAEIAGSGKYNQKKYLKNIVKGTYICSCCGNNLFRSNDIYDSGTGWPSFSKSYNSPNSWSLYKVNLYLSEISDLTNAGLSKPKRTILS